MVFEIVQLNLKFLSRGQHKALICKALKDGMPFAVIEEAQESV
jgi:hypothetical protein